MAPPEGCCSVAAGQTQQMHGCICTCVDDVPAAMRTARVVIEATF